MPAVYGGLVDKFPLGAFMEKGLTLRTGQTHVQRYMPALLETILEGKIDTTFLISHRLPLEQAPDGYKMFLSNVKNQRVYHFTNNARAIASVWLLPSWRITVSAICRPMV